MATNFAAKTHVFPGHSAVGQAQRGLLPHVSQTEIWVSVRAPVWLAALVMLFVHNSIITHVTRGATVALRWLDVTS